MSDLTKVPGKPSLRYAKGRGIYRLVKTENKTENGPGEVSWVPDEILHWCPTVLRYIVTKDSRGKITSARYTVEVEGHEDTIYAEELRSGEGWDRFPSASGHHDRQIKDTLASIVTHQAARLPQTVAAPYWDGDHLILSDPDLMAPGYGDRTGGPLAEILPIIEQNPKLALVLGFAYGAPYVEPLDRQPFWCHMTGNPRQGKSTGLNLAACLWGKPGPRGVIIPWNTTGNGVTAALGELSVLPAFLDDLHSAGFTASQIRKLIFSTVEGNSRMRSSRSGRRKDSAPWYGLLFSTGNKSILSMCPEPEVAARVIEIPSPLTDTATTSKMIKTWSRSNYGSFRAVPIVTMRAAVDQAEELLRGEIDGGTEETIMENLALGVAGAFVLGGKPLADAALHAARDILSVLVLEMAEAGVSAGERLLEAVRQYLVSVPGRFPTRDEYTDALKRADRPAPTVEGFWEPPVAYVLTSHLAAIAASYGLSDPRVGLRDLKAARLLLTESAANQLRRRIRAAGSRVDTYALILDPETVNSPTDTEPTRDTRDTRETPVQEAWDLSLVPEATRDASVPATVSAAPGPHATHEQPGTPQVNGGVPGPRTPEPPGTPTPAPPGTVDNPDRIAHGARSGQPGEPGVPGPGTRRPLRSVSASAQQEDQEEWDRWCEIIRAEDAWPSATPEEALAGLRAFRAALGGLRHLGTSAVTGQLLFHKLQAQHGSIPVLEAGGLPEGLELEPVARTFNYVDTSAPVERYPWVMSLDVNAQFLAVTGSVELGTGYAEPVTVPTFRDLREAKRYFGRPGYVQLAADAALNTSCTIPAGSWVAHPVAAYLFERRTLQAAPDGLLWPQHRRWLSAWGEVTRRARAALLVCKGDQAAEMALHALKLMYAAFLGGFLRSEAYNRGKTLRPDWNDQLVSLARMNMFRALERANPTAFATHLDAAYFLLEDNQSVNGVQLIPQAGKWKVAKVGRTDQPATITRGGKPITTTLAEQVSLGSVAGVRDAVADLDHQRQRAAA